MAAGVPVVGNCSPSSPVVHGVSGFLSDDPDVLRRCAQRLLSDRDLARTMGAEARRTARTLFDIHLFRERFARSIETARLKWQEKRAGL